MVQSPIHISSCPLPLPTLSALQYPEQEPASLCAPPGHFGRELVLKADLSYTHHSLSDRASLSKYLLDLQQLDNLPALFESTPLNPSSILGQSELPSSP